MASEKWMDKPIKVVLSMELTHKLTTSQTFYLDRPEAENLIEALGMYIDSEMGQS
ncbi:hypothetical protein D3C79_948450 [compost metagenome]